MIAKISLIVALAEDDAIGRRNDLPWNLRSDLKLFKALTLHKPMIMGSKTFKSLPGLLPRRLHVVVTRSTDNPEPTSNVLYVGSVQDAVDYVNANHAEAFVIGGAEIYRQFLEQDLVDVLYSSRVHTVVPDADTFLRLSELMGDRWVVDTHSTYEADDDNEYAFTAIKYNRTPQ